MSLLTDRDILKYIDEGLMVIDPAPFDSTKKKIRGCSIDIFLSNVFYDLDEVKLREGGIPSDSFEEYLTEITTNEFVLKPGKTVCVRTMEYIELPSNIAGIYKSRFRANCMGIRIDGIIHPGSKGYQILAVHNVSKVDFVLRCGESICQLLLFQTEHPCLDWYGKLEFAGA